jgi:hypothetical protein
VQQARPRDVVGVPADTGNGTPGLTPESAPFRSGPEPAASRRLESLVEWCRLTSRRTGLSIRWLPVPETLPPYSKESTMSNPNAERMKRAADTPALLRSGRGSLFISVQRRNSELRRRYGERNVRAVGRSVGWKSPVVRRIHREQQRTVYSAPSSCTRRATFRCHDLGPGRSEQSATEPRSSPMSRRRRPAGAGR